MCCDLRDCVGSFSVPAFWTGRSHWGADAAVPLFPHAAISHTAAPCGGARNDGLYPGDLGGWSSGCHLWQRGGGGTALVALRDGRAAAAAPSSAGAAGLLGLSPRPPHVRLYQTTMIAAGSPAAKSGEIQRWTNTFLGTLFFVVVQHILWPLPCALGRPAPRQRPRFD